MQLQTQVQQPTNNTEKKKLAKSELCFHGKRKSGVAEVARFIFGDNSVLYVEVLNEERTFEVFIRTEKIDKEICADKKKGEKRFFKKLPKCKLKFI